MIDRIFAIIRKCTLAITSIVFVASLIVLAINVFLRQTSSIPFMGNLFASLNIPGALTWAEEFMRYAIIWVTFMGCALCAEDDLHVGIDVFVQMAPAGVQKWLRAVGMLCGTVFCAFMVNFSWRNTMLVMAQKTPIMLISMSIVYVSMPIGALLTTLQFGRKTVQYIRMDPAVLDGKDDGDADIDLLKLN